MEPVSMKLPVLQTNAIKQEALNVGSEDREQWPYGLQISFEPEQIDLLPYLNEVQVGDKIVIKGIARITSISESECMNQKPGKCIRVQIESIKCEPEESKRPEEMSPREYRTHRTYKEDYY